MKKFFAIFTAVVLMPASHTMAGWRGGPFSNNNAIPSGDDGVYEAIAIMENGTGLYRFGVRNNGVSTQVAAGFGGGAGAPVDSSNVQFNAGLLSAFSSNVWYYKGITYYGVTWGIANSDMGIVAATGNASSTVAAGLATNNGFVLNNPSGNNIGFANSNFIAKFRDNGPAFRFSGTGQVTFTGNADTVTTNEAINITATNNLNSTNVTSPIVSPGGGTFNQTNTQSFNQNSANSFQRQGTGGEASDFPQRGHVRKFVVFGTKVSHVVAP